MIYCIHPIGTAARRMTPLKHRMLRFFCLWLALMLFSGSALAYEKLERGASGGDVLAMQQALKSLGYSIDTDGNYGYATMQTVKSFQKTHGLTADGVAGNQTLTLLYSLAPAFAPGNSGGTQTSSPAAAPSPAHGVTATVSTTGGSLNLRLSANGSAQVLTTIPNGAQVTVTQQGNTWCAVYYNGFAGYAMTEFLRFSSAPTPTASPAPTPAPVTAAPPAGSTWATVVTTGGSLNLRQSAQANARVLTTIPFGTRVTVTARGSSWCAVSYGGYSGFVMSQFLSFDSAQVTNTPTPSPTASPTPTASPDASGALTAWVQTSGGTLNLRAADSGSAKVITTIPNGTQLTVYQRGGTWCFVSYNGTAGWVMTSFLRFAAASPTATPTPTPTAVPPSSGITAYVKTTGGSLNLRASGQSNAKVLATIPNGTQLMITSRGSSWCATYYNGFSGFVMTSFLYFPQDVSQPTPTAAPTIPAGTVSTAVVTTSGGTLNLRAEASSSAKVLVTIPNAATLQVSSRGSEWSAVTYGAYSGYVMTKFLTFIGGASATTVPGAEEDDPSTYKRTLKSGMTGNDVSWVQSRLVELGYSLTATGTYDSQTIAAVKAFQGKNGLSVDGLAGPQTFAVLRSQNARRADAAALSYATLRVDNTGDGVKSLQNALKKLGYSVTVNGEYDVATHNAVVAFQQRNGLVISGIADSLTLQVLYDGNGKPYSTPVEELPLDAGKIAGPSVGEIKLLHWVNEIKPTVRAGQTITIFDPNTSLSWNLVFYSLGRHADSQPATWRDTQIMNRSFGSTSWTIHPVYVKLPSGQWTMATMHNRPHLYGSITDNGFGGHLCVHFLRDMEEAQLHDPNYGVNNQRVLRSAWKALTGETVD